MCQWIKITVVAAVVLACVTRAEANIVMETVPVGNLGNTGELSGAGAGGYGTDVTVGGVAYAYNMGKFEVTAGQYTAFLNAVAATDTHGLYNGSMWSDSVGCKIQQSGSSPNYTYSVAPGWADRPVNYVSWYDTLRFANWMHNGQGGGDTETGAYTMSLGSSVVRNPDAKWFLPTEDEWYKAAYHKNDGDTGNYFDYPTSNDSPPSNDLINPDPGNNATFWNGDNDYTIGSPHWRTVFGAHENSDSPYGTFDQGGNVWEWNETAYSASERIKRGGEWGSLVNALNASHRDWNTPGSEYWCTGFRVAEVPEPATLSLLALGGLAMQPRRRFCANS